LTTRFDAAGFFAAIDATRLARGLTWKQVAGQARVSASTLTRMGQGRRPDVDSLAALATWGNLPADEFMRGNKTDEALTGEPLAMISTYLRADRHLSPTAADALEAVIKATYERLRDTDEPPARLQD
jgi:transcriptional regulator with XRE-family HTH domain